MLERPDEPMQIGAETSDRSGCLTASQGCLATGLYYVLLEIAGMAIFMFLFLTVFDENQWMTFAAIFLVTAVIVVVEVLRGRKKAD